MEKRTLLFKEEKVLFFERERLFFEVFLLRNLGECTFLRVNHHVIMLLYSEMFLKIS